MINKNKNQSGGTSQTGDNNTQNNNYNIVNNNPTEITSIITKIANRFVEEILNKQDFSEIKINKIGNNQSYTLHDKIDCNKVIKYKKEIFIAFELNHKIKNILNEFDNIIAIYNFFSGLYSEAKREDINGGDNIISYVIENTMKNIQLDRFDKTHLDITSLYFVLHSFIECKILEKPKNAN